MYANGQPGNAFDTETMFPIGLPLTMTRIVPALWLKRLVEGGDDYRYLDADRHRLVEPRVRFNSNRREHDWLQLAVSATAPPNARYVEISFGLHGAGEVYLDDLELVVVAGSRIPDPAVRIGTVDRRPGP